MALGEDQKVAGQKITGGKEALELMRRAGLRVLRTEEAEDENRAVALAGEMGYPVALKIAGAEHKTELGGVKVPLKDAEEVREAFRELREIQPAGPLLVQEVGQGFEAFVGAIRDPLFGPVVAFGLGGIFVEVLGNVSFRLLPIERRDIEEMLTELRAGFLLHGARGYRVKFSVVEELLIGVSSFVLQTPWIGELDLNPVFLSEDGYRICDARIRGLREGPPGG